MGSQLDKPSSNNQMHDEPDTLLFRGVRSAKQFADLESRLLAAFTIILPTIANHIEAAVLGNKCLARGFSASGPDCLIAVMAISGGHELFAVDSDFAAIAQHAPLKLFVRENGQ